jgi:hypothetical protein
MLEELIPYFAMTVLFVIPAMICLTATILWFRSRNKLYQNIEEALKNDAPPEVVSQLVALTESKESREPKASRVKRFTDAAFWVAIGVGFIVFFFNGGPRPVIFPGVFMSLYGLILLCIAVFVVKDDNSDKGDKPDSE